MNDSLYIAATGMQAQQLSIDSIANNLANVTTTGFKKGRVNFQELMQVPASATAPRASALGALGLGISVDSVAKDFTAGALTQTNSAWDVALNGSGFIAVTQADGSRGYSRGGTLHVSKDGYLATSNGNLLAPSIHVPADASALQVGADGKVTVQLPNRSQPLEIGQIELANFTNAAGLKVAGPGVYTPTDESGDALPGKPGAQGFGSLVQGSVEGSNVSMVDEMVILMIAQRAYEMSSKVVQASDEIMSLTNNLRR